MDITIKDVNSGWKHVITRELLDGKVKIRWMIDTGLPQEDQIRNLRPRVCIVRGCYKITAGGLMGCWHDEWADEALA
jgi:hypothetical protein